MHSILDIYVYMNSKYITLDLLLYLVKAQLVYFFVHSLYIILYNVFKIWFIVVYRFFVKKKCFIYRLTSL